MFAWLILFLFEWQQAFFHQTYQFLFFAELCRRQRRRQTMMMIILSQLNKRNARTRRRAWHWPRLTKRPLHFLWKEHFRMSYETFEFICSLIRRNLQKQLTRFRVPISVEERVGITLWQIAMGDNFRSCGLQFGRGRSTAKAYAMNLKKPFALTKTVLFNSH